jgi:hypothetical protein
MITHERLKDVLHYDPDTGAFTWARTRPKAPQGRSAGCIKPDGYRYIKIDKYAYLAHRLAWLYVHGEWPNLGLDHVNRIRSDNRFCNIRQATVSQNGANCSHKNPLGLKGVQFIKGAIKNPYAARIVFQRKTHYLGTFPTKEMAHEAYKKASERVFGQFSNP